MEADKQACSGTKRARQRKEQTARRDTRKAAKQGEEPDGQTAALAASSSSYLTAGPGDPAASKFRITYCARQTITGYFDSSVQPAGHFIN